MKVIDMDIDVDNNEGSEDENELDRLTFDVELSQRIRKAKGLRNKKPKDVPISTFQEEWLAFYSSPKMARSGFLKHRQILQELAAWAESTADFTPQLVACWIDSLMERQLRPASIKSMLGHFRIVCGYAVRRNYLESNPVDARERWLPNTYAGRAAPTPPNRLGHSEAANLMAYLLARTHTWEGHRLFALAATGLYTGLKKSRLLELKVNAWNPTDEKLEQDQPIYGRVTWSVKPKLAEILNDWVPKVGCEWMFPGVRRLGPWTGGAPGERPQDRLKAAGLAIGLKRLTFECLRQYWDCRSVAYPRRSEEVRRGLG